MDLIKIKQKCPLYDNSGKIVSFLVFQKNQTFWNWYFLKISIRYNSYKFKIPKDKDDALEKEFNKLLEATSYLSHNLGEFLNIFRHNPIGYLFSFCFLLKILIQRLKISLFLSVMLLNWLLSRLFFFIIWDFDKEKIKIN